MTARRNPPTTPAAAGAERGADGWIDRLTGRIGKLTALVLAIGGLFAALFTQSDKVVSLLGETGWFARPPCLMVESPVFPPSVKWSEWNQVTIALRGRNDCTHATGLYMTFFRDVRNDELFVIQPPRGDHQECRELRADLYPNCWDYKKPVLRGKGDWRWDVPLPPLDRLADPRPSERLLISWSVRNYDDPTKPAILADTAVIEIDDDMPTR